MGLQTLKSMLTLGDLLQLNTLTLFNFQPDQYVESVELLSKDTAVSSNAQPIFDKIKADGNLGFKIKFTPLYRNIHASGDNISISSSICVTENDIPSSTKDVWVDINIPIIVDDDDVITQQYIQCYITVAPDYSSIILDYDETLGINDNIAMMNILKSINVESRYTFRYVM